jgi:hypothetical protein
MAGFDVSGVEPSGYASRVLFIHLLNGVYVIEMPFRNLITNSQ